VSDTVAVLGIGVCRRNDQQPECQRQRLGCDIVTFAARLRPWGAVAAVGAGVFVLSVVGIDSRLPGSLAVLWPANALLLGILIRAPRLRRRRAVWPAAAVGYVAADLVHGTPTAPALVFALANLTGVALALLVLGRLDAADVRDPSAPTVVRRAGACVVGAAAGAVLGAWATSRFIGGSWAEGWLGWFASDLVNYACLLPALLTMPATVSRPTVRRALASLRGLVLPWLLLVLLLGAAWLMRESASAVAFAVPALMACALLGRPFATAVMVLASTVAMLALSVGMGGGVAPAPLSTTSEIALALLAVGPLAVAAALAERHRLLDDLREATTRDDLTGVLRRGEFALRAEAALAGAREQGSPSSLLMMDLDHFKQLNDRRGHRAGDVALVGFGEILRDVLADDAVIGRVGGEEFAALLPGCGAQRAQEYADEVRRRQARRAAADFGADGTTVSIGVAADDRHSGVDELMAAADAAVYRAKRRGRDEVVFAADSLPGGVAPVAGARRRG
jgi:diguanylate cyclase (GGDEF)-like protein